MREASHVIWLALFAAIVAVAFASFARPDPHGASVTAYQGTMRPACAPHDARSVELTLESVTGRETVSFNLWPRTPVWPPTTIRFDARHPVGEATYCSSGGNCEQAEWGELRLTASEDPAGLTGAWSIGLDGGGIRRGTFEAEWMAMQSYCG